MNESISAQDKETSLKFCLYIIEKEMQKFNLDSTVYKTSVIQLPELDINFDEAYNRCAFVYKYTLCNLNFFKHCMNKFILECSTFKNLAAKWSADSNISLCSLSCGPGLDYLSFMLALSDHLTPPSFKSVTLLAKHDAWRNTVDIVADALQEGMLSESGIKKVLNFKSIEVVQTNLLISIPAKGLEALQRSSIILMVKTLNLTSPGTNEKGIWKTKLLSFISSLKPEATIFFIDTKPSLAIFLEILTKFDGKFLFNPKHLSFKVPATFSEECKEKNGCLPEVCSSGDFLVWQKLSSYEPDLNSSISLMRSPTDLKETALNSLDKSSNDNQDVLSITKTLKDIVPPNNKSQPISEDNTLTTSGNKCLQSASVANIFSVSNANNIGESVPVASSLVNTPRQVEIRNPASIQTSLAPQSAQDLSLINLEEDVCSSKSLPFFRVGNLRPNSIYSRAIGEDCATSTPQPNLNKKELHRNKKIVFQSNQVLKPTSESIATQTELHQSDTNPSVAEGLTERIAQLVSSLENKVQKNISDGQVNYQMHGNSNRIRNYSFCSANYNTCGGLGADTKPQCCNGNNAEREIPTSCCHSVHINHVHCRAVRHHMVHRREMHCCGSYIHRCHVNLPFCETDIACAGTSSVQPLIIFPIHNVANDMLLQITSAPKSGLTNCICGHQGYRI